MPSILDTPFRFNDLSDDQLSPRIETKLQTTQEENQKEMLIPDEYRVVSQSGKDITIGSNACTGDRLKHLVIRDCISTRFIFLIPFASVQISESSDCRLDFMVVKGPVSVTSCNKLRIFGFCSQLRLTDCLSIVTHIQTASSTALVNCSEVEIYPPPQVEPGSSKEACLGQIGMNREVYLKSTKWKSVSDFDSLTGSRGNFVIHEFTGD